jgi:hypothetical protein
MGSGGRPFNGIVSQLQMTQLETEVLDRCGNDYEAPHTIASDIARDLKRPVSDAEVRAAFRSLAVQGLVDAYVFDDVRNQYVPISASAAQLQDAAWFTITVKGRERSNEAG